MLRQSPRARAGVMACSRGGRVAALLCLNRRSDPQQFSNAEVRKQLRRSTRTVFIQRRLTVESRQVPNDAHHHICTVTKARQTATKSMAGSHRPGRSKM